MTRSDRTPGSEQRTPNARNRRVIVAIVAAVAFLAILLVVLALIFRSDDARDAGQTPSSEDAVASGGAAATDGGAAANNEDDAASNEEAATSGEEDTAGSDDGAAEESPTPSIAEELAWYEGGTLRTGNGDDWKNATARDRLATAAALAAEALSDTRSEPVHPEEMSEEELSAFRVEAEALAACIDEAAQTDGSASVARMATTCWTQAHPAPEK